MADNIIVLDGLGSEKTMRTTDDSGIHTAHHLENSVQRAALLAAIAASNILPYKTAGTDRSGSISVNAVAETLAAGNAERVALTIQNISSGDLWINEFGDTAAPSTAGSYKIPAGYSCEISTNQAVSVYGATAGQAWTATEV